MDENPYQSPQSEDREQALEVHESYRGIMMQVFIFLSAFIGVLYTWDETTFMLNMCFYLSLVLGLVAFMSLLKIGYGAQSQFDDRERNNDRDSEKESVEDRKIDDDFW